MENISLRLFDIYREAVVAVGEDGKIAYMNGAAVSLFGGDRRGSPAEEVIDSPLLGAGGDAVSYVTVGGQDYTASRSMLGGYAVISVTSVDAALPQSSDTLLRSLAAEAGGSLGTMNVALGLMRQNLEKPGFEKLMQYAAHIDREYHALCRITDHIYACLPDGAQDEEGFSSCDLAAELGGLISTSAVLLRGSGAELRFSCDVESLPFRGSSRLISELVLNLISNSVESGAADITVSLKRTAKGAILSVSDNGSGVKSGALGNVFGSYGAERDLADPAAGVGLGLTVVRRIAQKHGGGVILETREGGGTVVSVTLNSVSTDPDPTLRAPEYQCGGDMQLILTELSDVLDYTAYFPGLQD